MSFFDNIRRTPPMPLRHFTHRQLMRYRAIADGPADTYLLDAAYWSSLKTTADNLTALGFDHNAAITLAAGC